MKVGLLGGAFDPVHIGHLNGANQAADRFGLSRVYFVPTAVAPHKKRWSASPADRLAMVQKAVRSNPRFRVSRREMNGDRPSYTIDTVSWFAKKRGIDLYYIIGMDAFRDLHSWHSAAELLRLCNFIVMTRPGVLWDDVSRELVREFRADGVQLRRVGTGAGSAERGKLRAGGSKRAIHLCAFPGMEVSSTMIRDNVAAGRSIKYLVPEPVEQYIIKRGLYRR